AALAASAPYAAALLGLLALWPRGREMQALHALLMLAAAGLAGAAGAGLRLGLRPSERPAARALLREHWTYGRWIAAATLASGVSTLAVFPLLALVAGAEQSGALRALTHLPPPPPQPPRRGL